jgi:hypothetical protein
MVDFQAPPLKLQQRLDDRLTAESELIRLTGSREKNRCSVLRRKVGEGKRKGKGKDK